MSSQQLTAYGKAVIQITTLASGNQTSSSPLTAYAKAVTQITSIAGKAVPSTSPLTAYAKTTINIISLASGSSTQVQPSTSPLTAYAKAVTQIKVLVTSSGVVLVPLTAYGIVTIEIGQVPIQQPNLTSPVTQKTIVASEEGNATETVTPAITPETAQEAQQNITNCQNALKKYLQWANG